MPQGESSRGRRQSTYRVLIFVALAIAAGRIAVVSRDGVTALLSANDKSRWCTVASLVERGTYTIDAQEEVVVTNPVTKKQSRPWRTIDKVRHTGKDGKLHYYSSKPPLFPTMVAGLYAVVTMLTGMTLTAEPMYVTRILLALVNLPLLALFYFACVDAVERVGLGEWTKRAAAIAVCFGTMLLPFAVTLNNHLPAAAATAVTMWIYIYAAERLDASTGPGSEGVSLWCYLVAGLAAAFAAANELPALSMFVFWFALFFFIDRRSVLPYAAGAAIVAAGFFGTNWIAHESLRPAYAHRGIGPVIADLPSLPSTPDDQTMLQVEKTLREKKLIADGTKLSISASDEAGRWVVQADGQLFALLSSDWKGASSAWQLAHWDDWYEYPDTHWKPENLTGVDRGESSRLVYLAQITIGHHGLFSLHPIWLLVPIGLFSGIFHGPPDFRRLVFAIMVSTVVCLLFYLSRPTIDRNYGGVSVCFRWMLWFAPLWLVVITPVIDSICVERRWRNAVIAMLAISAFSVSTALASPWQHPWLYQFWAFLGWIDVS